MVRRSLFAAALLASALAMPAAAQNAAPAGAPPAVRFAGTVQAVSADGYQVRVADGSTLTFKLAPDGRVMMRKPAKLTDLGAGGFVGCTAVKAAGEALHATECHIFPESMRGAGEGHNPMQAPATTMTNGSVATMTNGAVQAAGASGASVLMKVVYKGGEQLIEATGQTEVTLIVPLAADQIRVGTQVTGAARPTPDGGAVVAILNVVP